MILIEGKYTNAKVMVDELDQESRSQITKFVNNPSFSKPITIMSDVHAGKGAVIGFTMPLTDRVIPAVVGVDIGCGMVSLNLGQTLPKPLADLDIMLRSKIPFGFHTHDKPVINMERDFPWHRTQVLAEKFVASYGEKFGEHLEQPRYDMNWFLTRCAEISHRDMTARALNSLGTLGGGNHFLETGLADNGDHWFTIHTGSRNFGKCVCDFWQGVAVRKIRRDRKGDHLAEIERIKSENTDGKIIFQLIKEAKARYRQENDALKDLDVTGLEWLEGKDAAGYLFDMIFSQVYAEVNREYIARIACDVMKIEPKDRIETVHNFIDFRDFIVRKGAVRSYAGERFILPFNMRDGILICDGKSNPEWNFSSPHGAGRVMSRAQARKRINVQTFREQMVGIVSSSVGEATLDEAPDAYKDAKMIEAAIEPTAKVLWRIKPLHNMKSGDEE